MFARFMSLFVFGVILAEFAGLFRTSGCSLLAEEPKREVLHSQSCVVLENANVRLAVTVTGGHMAPVTFYRNTELPVEPYYVSPWQDEPRTEMPVPVLVPLRGDFFCMPFGGNTESINGEQHPPHGEIAGIAWTDAQIGRDGKVSTLRMTADTSVRKGRVTKQLSLIDGQNVVYSRHTIEGFSGNAPLGHHATLAMPDREGSVRIAVSPIRFGMTCPGVFSNPVSREYQRLQPGARWNSLSQVPVAWKQQPDADLTRLPGAQGFADLVQIFPHTSTAGEPAWVTATFPETGFVWFSLKDPAILNSTVFWMENRGRHGHPWNGRNNCLGLEDVTAFFADGLSASVSENVLTREGISTSISLSAHQPTSILYIQGVVRVPKDFDVVESVRFAPESVTFISASQTSVTVPVRHEFLKDGRLSAASAAVD